VDKWNYIMFVLVVIVVVVVVVVEPLLTYGIRWTDGGVRLHRGLHQKPHSGMESIYPHPRIKQRDETHSHRFRD